MEVEHFTKVEEDGVQLYAYCAGGCPQYRDAVVDDYPYCTRHGVLPQDGTRPNVCRLASYASKHPEVAYAESENRANMLPNHTRLSGEEY
jgi:hypothetical protein